MTNRVTVEISEHVATVTLNRADKRNAIDVAMFDALIATGDSLKKESGVRAVVLHGAGEHFCAGIDISVFQGEGIAAAGKGLMQPRDGSSANYFQSAAMVWRELPVPVIAALRGTAFGGGLQIALGADLRYAAADTRMSVMEIKWGIIPDMGITNTLRHIVREDQVRELSYTGRVFDADEAKRLGIVTDVVDDPLAVSRQVAADIAQKSPDAIRAMKKLVNESWHAEPAAALRMEAELQVSVMAGKNQKEAVLANMEGRAPRFADPE